MKLAKALGKFVYEIDQIDSQELTRWMAYEQIEGLAPVESWQQAAQITYYGNSFVPSVKPTDFDPYYVTPIRTIKPQTAQEQIAVLCAAFPNAIKKADDSPT